MATYTGVADANGDFTVPFTSAYTSGQKITVTAEKNNATKSIELYAPSEFIGGGVIQFSGTMENFPNNIGVVTLKSDISGEIQANTFNATNSLLFQKAKGLKIDGLITQIQASGFRGWLDAEILEINSSTLAFIGQNAFQDWSKCKSLSLSSSITAIGNFAFSGWSDFDGILHIPLLIQSIGTNAFQNWITAKGVTFPPNINLAIISTDAFSTWSLAEGLELPSGITTIQAQAFIAWSKATTLTLPDTLQTVGNSAFWGWNKLTSLTIPTSVTSLEAGAFENMSSCNELICMKVTPPAAVASTFAGLKSMCLVKVPSASLSAYQSAPGWSEHASKMIGI